MVVVIVDMRSCYVLRKLGVKRRLAEGLVTPFQAECSSRILIQPMLSVATSAGRVSGEKASRGISGVITTPARFLVALFFCGARRCDSCEFEQRKREAARQIFVLSNNALGMRSNF